MQPNPHFTRGMVKVAILAAIGSGLNKLKTVGYNAVAPTAKKAIKGMFSKIDPKTGQRRLSLGRTALTAGAGVGTYVLGKKMLGNASEVGGRDYMSDIHNQRPSDTLRVGQ